MNLTTIADRLPVSIIRLLAFCYTALFFVVVATGYIPAFRAANGLEFGLFDLDIYDDALHAFSGLWALGAGLMSTSASTFYFRLFGTVYLMDGIFGLFLGSGFLDLGIFKNGIREESLYEHVFANLPHIVIGGFASFAGFYISKLPWATRGSK